MWMKYPNISPYVRVANNPLKYFDPTGTVVEFDNEDDAKKQANDLNKIHDDKTNITVKRKEKKSINLIKTISNFLSGNGTVSYSTTTVFQLSTENSNFNWNQNAYTSALYDVINSQKITFQVNLTDTYNGNSLQLYGGGFIDSQTGGANVFIDPSGYKGISMGYIFMHDVVGHGHPVTGLDGSGNAASVDQHYYNRNPRGHYGGYHTNIGWKEWHLYNN